MKWKSKRHTLYQEVNESGGIRLQVIYMTIGDCETKLYQELIWNKESIETNEYSEIPLAWNRWIVINEALYFKTYYQVNKEKMDNYSKEWKKKNKEKWNQYQRQRLKKLRSAQKEIAGQNHTQKAFVENTTKENIKINGLKKKNNTTGLI